MADGAGSERGSVTAEFAAALPAVLLCLAFCIGAVQAAAQQARLLGHAASAARLLARGDAPPAAPSGTTRSVATEAGLLCVSMSAPSETAGMGVLGMTVSARACVLAEQEQT
jgi:Flp pilus assembly protein TadG